MGPSECWLAPCQTADHITSDSSPTFKWSEFPVKLNVGGDTAAKFFCKLIKCFSHTFLMSCMKFKKFARCFYRNEDEKKLLRLFLDLLSKSARLTLTSPNTIRVKLQLQYTIYEIQQLLFQNKILHHLAILIPKKFLYGKSKKEISVNLKPFAEILCKIIQAAFCIWSI